MPTIASNNNCFWPLANRTPTLNVVGSMSLGAPPLVPSGNPVHMIHNKDLQVGLFFFQSQAELLLKGAKQIRSRVSLAVG